MRFVFFLSLAATGCSGLETTGGGAENAARVDIEASFDLDVRVNSVVLRDSGRKGQAGMFGTTCSFVGPSLEEDFDYPGSDETVEDLGELDGETVILVRSRSGVHVQELGATGPWWTAPPEWSVTDALAARLIAGDVLAVRATPTGCELRTRSAPDQAIGVPVACTAASVAVDAESGTTWLSDGDALYRVDGGATRIGEGASALAWDAISGTLFAADERGVRALDGDGRELWSTRGNVASLATLGTLGAVAVHNGGTVAFLDVETGASLGVADLGLAARAVHAAPDGSALAALGASDTRVFTVTTD